MSRTTTVDTAPANDVSDIIAPQPNQFIKRGTPQFIRVTLALFSAGLATFALLYCVQPILPVLSSEFGVSPVPAAVSRCRFPRRCWRSACCLPVRCPTPLVPQTGDGYRAGASLLLLTAVDDDVQLAWDPDDARPDRPVAERRGGGRHDLSERRDSPQRGGVLNGSLYQRKLHWRHERYRLLTGVFTDFFGWRIALAVISGFALAAALMFWRILPESRHFRPTSLRSKSLLINFRLHWRDRGLPLLFLEGFLLMGSFVTLFNYIGYRLMLSPWSLSQAVVGLLSVAYLTGTWSSPKAGAMTVRYGRGPVLLFSTAVMLGGLLLTLFSSLWLIFIGMLLFSAGFFAAHSVVQQLDWPARASCPRTRRHRSIYSATIWVPAWRGR